MHAAEKCISFVSAPEHLISFLYNRFYIQNLKRDVMY